MQGWRLGIPPTIAARPTYQNSRKTMNLTNPEKLVLVMLAEIHEALKIKNGVDTKLLKNAIYRDNTWA
jgi:hypothetical protein